MQFIETPLALLPAGHYSQAVVANGFVFVSGVLPLPPGANKTLPAGMEAQCEQVFINLRHVLEASASSLQHLVNVQVFIPDVGLWPEVNAIYQRMLGTHKPARTVVPCGALHYGALIEINAVALVNNRD